MPGTAEEEGEGEKGKYGDPKKLYKFNKELVKHNSQLCKQLEALKNDRDSLALDKSKLKADLKSTEKELKKVGASLTSARSEVDRLRAKSHKQGGGANTGTGEGVEELQEKVRQLEAELSQRNEKLAQFKKKVGSRLSLLEGGGNGLSEDCEPASELANSESASEEESSKYQLGVEQEANAKLEKENSELRSRLTNLESDLNNLLELMDDQQRGKFVLNTEQRSSREIHLQSTDANAELKLNGRDSPLSSPSASPSVRRRNQTSVDVATLQTCLKLALDEKKVIAQQNERLSSRLGSAASELEETRRMWQQEKEELLQLLLKARAEIDAREAREAQEMKLLEVEGDAKRTRETREPENKKLPEVDSDAKGTRKARVPENQKLTEVESDTKGTRESQVQENKKPPEVESASKEIQQQQSESSSTETMAGSVRPSSSTASSTEQQSTATSDSSREQKSEPVNADQSKGEAKSQEKRKRSGARRGPLQKQPSRENFTAALAIFQNGGGAAPVVGTSFAKPVSKRERRTSEMSDDGHSPQSLASPASTSSPSSPRKQSTESRPEPAVVAGKPPIPPSSSHGSDAHSRQSTAGEKSSSKMGVASKRMSWTIAQRRKSFEEQSEEPSTLKVQAQHTRTSSSPNVNTTQGSPVHARKEDKTKALEEAKRAEEEKAKREKEEKRRQEMEAEERRKRELEEKRQREAKERERLREEREERERLRREEKEERERLRREREEKEREQKRELEEKRKCEKEEREKKRHEELERKRQLEEKKKQEQLAQQELQRAKEIERAKEREAERDAALKKQRQGEDQKKQEKEEREERLRLEEERRAAEKAAQAAIDPRPHKINQRQSPFGSIAMRRAAFEQNNSPSSSPPVTLRQNRSSMQRPKSMDVGALLSTTSAVSPSHSPTPQSPGLTNILIKTSISPHTSPTLNERKEIKVGGKPTSISKPNPPPTVNRQSAEVSIVTTGTSSPTLRRSKTLSSATTSLAVSTPDLTSVGTSKEGNSNGGGGSGWSPGSQRRTVLSTTPKSPLSERKMTKSVSFSPTPARSLGVSRPGAPPVAGQPSSPEKVSFKAVPARLGVPAVDIKKAQSLQNIPEHAPVENITSPTISEVTRQGPVVQRRPRSERAKTTSLSRADAVSLLSKLNEKEKSVEKPVGNGVQPTLRTSRSTYVRPLSMYDSITPARYV